MAVFERTVVVTGGTSGIGMFCATELARDAQTRVVIASRPLPDNVVHLTLDLLSRQTIRNLVSAWAYGPVAALVCNAGLQTIGSPEYTSDGIERTFAANHVGHALLFFLLHRRGLFQPTSRVIFVTSGTHDPKEPMIPDSAVWAGADDTAKAADPRLQNGAVRYATSKLANVMFSNKLADKAKAAGKQWTVNAFDPGFCPGNGSKFMAVLPGPAPFVFMRIVPHLLWLLGWLGMAVSTPAHAGATLAALATSDEVKGVSGKYFQIDTARIKPSSDDSYDLNKQQDLWDWTIREIAASDAERQAFDFLEESV